MAGSDGRRGGGRIILAYSGGRQSSAAMRWLADTYGSEIVTVTLDLGQGDDLVAARARALADGAARSHVLDVRETFARDYLLPSLKAQALSEGRYPMVTALGRPLVARMLVDIARIEEATAVAHGGPRRDHARIGGPVQVLEPALRVIACPAVDERPRADRNLWGRTVGCGPSDPSVELLETVYLTTRPPESGPAHPAVIDIRFERGVPVTINGVPMPLVELIESLSTIAAEHGVGRLDRVKRRLDGSTSRAVWEAPAAVVLHAAQAELASVMSSPSLTRFARTVATAYADVIDRGEWFTPLRHALDAFVDVQSRVTGTVGLKLFKGDCRVVRRSVEPEPLRPLPPL